MLEQLNALKYVTDTISSDRKESLPRVIPTLVDHLSCCSDILCGRIDGGPAPGAKVHKLKTQLSSLLQDRHVESRWASVVLIKTVVEAVVKRPEGWEFLQSTGSWIRGLLALLGKPDPVPTKTMAMLILTRLFLLTKGRPSLTREITTPHLGLFVTACLNNVTVRDTDVKSVNLASPLLEAVLQCFIRLLPNHPAIFRPFSTQIRSLICPLLAPTPSDLGVSQRVSMTATRRVIHLAQRLHSLLPHCAPKNGAAEHWRSSVHGILNHINRTADSALRAVLNNSTGGLKDDEQLAQEARGQINDDLLLSAWEGVPAGCERIVGLIELLSAYMDTEGTVPYQVPVRSIYELVDRLLSIARPQTSKSDADLHFNRLVSREEREIMFMFLPSIQTAVLQLMTKLLARMSTVAHGFAIDLFEQVAWMTQKSNLTAELRCKVFELAGQIIQLVGPSLSSESSTSIKILIRLACKELDPQPETPISVDAAASKGASAQSLQYNADSFISSSMAEKKQARFTDLQIQASVFLRTATLNIPSSVLSQSRLQMDRVAVLLQDQELLLASILNPSTNQHGMNMLPFLNTANQASDVFIEALIRRHLASNRPDAVVDEEQSSTPREASDDEQIMAPVNDFSFGLVEARPPDALDIVADDHKMEIVTQQTSRRDGHDNDMEEPTPKRVKFDLESVSQPSRVSPPTTEAPEVIDAKTISVVEAQQVESGDASDVDSDGSFEVPEIVVGSDDSDDEVEED